MATKSKPKRRRVVVKRVKMWGVVTRSGCLRFDSIYTDAGIAELDAGEYHGDKPVGGIFTYSWPTKPQRGKGRK